MTTPDQLDEFGYLDEEAEDAGERLEDRYGRRPAASSSGIPRRWWAALAMLIVGVVVFWGFTSLTPSSTIEFQTVGFRVDSPTNAELTARVSVQPGTPLACVIEAKNDRDANVGWKVVELPASSDAHQVITEQVVTIREASALAIRECWTLPSQ